MLFVFYAPDIRQSIQPKFKLIMCRILHSFLFLLAIFFAFHDNAIAKERDTYRLEGYLYDIDQQFIDSFIAYNSLNHMAAIGSTTILVKYDIDWHYYRYFEQNKKLQFVTFPPVLIGLIGPVALPAYLHYSGMKYNNKHRLYTAYSVGQSAILSIAITSIYKSLTGRLEPDLFNDSRTLEQSKQFEFGFWNNGIFHGWPSGHATTAMAIATSLTEMYPNRHDRHAWWILGALYISAGISTNIHWLSDAVAGSLIGYGIGKTVGKAYYKKLTHRKQKQAHILPMAGPNSIGLIMTKRF